MPQKARVRPLVIWGLRLAIALGIVSALVLSLPRDVVGPAPQYSVIVVVMLVRSTVGETLMACDEVIRGAVLVVAPTFAMSLALVHLIPTHMYTLGAALHLLIVPLMTFWVASVGLLTPVSLDTTAPQRC
jgi:hypothetical protein